MRKMVGVRRFGVIMLLLAVGVAESEDYGGGSGTATEPYLIYTAEHMNAIGLNSEDWDMHFKLMADIDLEVYTGTSFNMIKSGTNGFSGHFDGNGHVIMNFTYVSSSENFVGLIGYANSGAMIKNVVLINPHVEGSLWPGSLVGHNRGYVVGCSVLDCDVSGEHGIGGLVGLNTGTISESYSIGIVSGYNLVGGLVGHNNKKITKCRSSANVFGGYSTGGLVGDNTERGRITDCYAQGNVWNDQAAGTGGLVGHNYGEISRCYSTGAVSSVRGMSGGLVGNNVHSEALIESSVWDIQTSGLEDMCRLQILGARGCYDSRGRTTARMQTQSTFTSLGWDFVGETANGVEDIWFIEGVDYPRLVWEKCLDRVEVEMKLTPQTINVGSSGKWIKAHFKLPEGVLPGEVDVNTPAVLKPLGIESEYIDVFVNDEGLVEVVAAFNRSEFCSSEPFGESIVVEGLSFADNCFYGVDSIRVIDKRFEVIKALAAHWIEDCAEPEWCDGSDVDKDGVVNLRDFARLKGFCAEFMSE